MSVLDRIFGRRNEGAGIEVPAPKSTEYQPPSRTHSIFSDYPDRVLKTESDVRKDDALLEMSLVVNEVANDPDTNWTRSKADFEKAVTGMREAFESTVSQKHEAGLAPEHSPIFKQLSESGWKLSSRDERAVSAYEHS